MTDLIWTAIILVGALVAYVVLAELLFARYLRSTTAPLQTAGTESITTTTEETSPMGIVADIEKRFTVVPRIVDDVEQAARSRIGQELLGVAKTALELCPEGRELSLVITKLEEVEQWAHKSLATASTVVADVQADTPAAGEKVDEIETPTPEVGQSEAPVQAADALPVDEPAVTPGSDGAAPVSASTETAADASANAGLDAGHPLAPPAAGSTDTTVA